MNGDLVVFGGEEAICYFNLQPIEGRWYVDVIFIESKIGDLRIHTVPWAEIKFIGDKDNKKKWGYMQAHIASLRRARKIKDVYVRVTEGIKNLLTVEILTENLLWGMN
ncbi:hypothetical protein CVU82_03415 [Candidatus Falkowbacteria bacterium HGW-Falkowbacteria-1]|jgi:hypothetical protein|uniref:Uncharacterized protein n=1 Tax=Candidatus Falkowbacteria bacterium HGW-Falkowbacteria-1 TaxID=2013768 RepID=A0A2N2E8Q8_9BACT|nr:MAG: hypothetical protein CVU82_03415 [Candidatus Falkowbacteria bacterium HGW-Falkowbacteria-1]